MGYCLAIESSCDESAIAFLDTQKRQFLFEEVASQIALHQQYGGVVPELAAREHLKAFPVLIRHLREKFPELRPNQIAVTCGPGLAAGLALGISTAKALGIYFGVPVVGVNHLRAHAFSPFILRWLSGENLQNYLPHIALLVSGGNSLLFQIDEQWRFSLLGETVDDTAGEALDKTARLLGLPYPGGREISRLAVEGDPHKFSFPRAFPREMQMSFSGLKTAIRYQIEAMSPDEVIHERNNLCASCLEAILETLIEKLRLAISLYRPRSFGISGGVSQNIQLRERAEAESKHLGLPVLFADESHCGDNAGMVAFASVIDPQIQPSVSTFFPKLPILS